MSLRLPGKIIRLGDSEKICWRCSQRLFLSPWQRWRTGSRSFTQSYAPSTTVATVRSISLKTGFFLSSGPVQATVSEQSFRRSTAATAASTPLASHNEPEVPHRRRQALRRSVAKTIAASATILPRTPIPDNALPVEDASSALTTAAAKHSARSIQRQLSLYLSLSKPRLTVLVVLTAMSSYALYPVPDFLSPTLGLDTPSLSPLTLAYLTTGTALCSAAANALNMLYEPKTDGIMSRTRNRPLVRGLLSQRSAFLFALFAAISGVAGLYYGVNPTVALLASTNIFLYAAVYTPMKRLHWFNTWVGAIVGGIPPLMGWAAAAGESATGSGSFRELLLTRDSVGGWLMAGLLFAWQFPHFMALSWTIREEYKKAGLKMLSWVNPARNARVALRYSLAFFPICLGLCVVGATEWTFALTSIPINVWLTREAVRFWRYEGLSGSARGLFWASVWHLPVVLVLALVQKRGMWGRVWRTIFGEEYDDDDEEWDDDEGEPIPIPVPVSRKAGGNRVAS